MTPPPPRSTLFPYTTLFRSSMVEAPFVFTVSYTPSIAQLSVKGKAQVTGDRSEVAQMTEEHKKNRPPPQTVRSEEHTSELQSHSDLVCRLLLEKKKDRNKPL